MAAPAATLFSLRPYPYSRAPHYPQHKLKLSSSAVLPLSLSSSFQLSPTPCGKLSSSTCPSAVLRAVAVDSDQTGSSQPPPQVQAQRYYFLVANAKFMLDEEEHFQEQLSERLRLFAERNRPQDFWLVIEPNFLANFPDIANRLKRPAVALVSTDAQWITFMKLRLDRVLANNFEAHTLDQALASTPVDLQFDKPHTWTAPYPKYEFGWWHPFLPPKSHNNQA